MTNINKKVKSILSRMDDLIESKKNPVRKLKKPTYNKLKQNLKSKPAKLKKKAKKRFVIHCFVRDVSMPFNGCRGPKKIRRR